MLTAGGENAATSSPYKKVSLDARNKRARMKMQVYQYSEAFRRVRVLRMRVSRSGMVCRQDAVARFQATHRETAWNPVAMMNTRFQVAISPGDLREPVYNVPALKLETRSQIAIPLPGIVARCMTWTEGHGLSASWRWESTAGQRRRHGRGYNSLEELSMPESRWIPRDSLPSLSWV